MIGEISMERSEKTDSILRQFKKKSKRIVNKDFFTEFFYLNKNRRVIEFLYHEDSLILESFFKKFLPEEFKEFVSLKILNDSEEEIRSWFYENENLVLVLAVNWGFKKQEISIDIDIESFEVSIINEDGSIVREIDYVLLNEFIISFLTNQAQALAQAFEKLTNKKNKHFN